MPWDSYCLRRISSRLSKLTAWKMQSGYALCFFSLMKCFCSHVLQSRLSAMHWCSHWSTSAHSGPIAVDCLLLSGSLDHLDKWSTWNWSFWLCSIIHHFHQPSRLRNYLCEDLVNGIIQHTDAYDAHEDPTHKCSQLHPQCFCTLS